MDPNDANPLYTPPVEDINGFINLISSGHVMSVTPIILAALLTWLFLIGTSKK